MVLMNQERRKRDGRGPRPQQYSPNGSCSPGENGYANGAERHMQGWYEIIREAEPVGKMV